MEQLIEAIKQNNFDKVKELISTVNINEIFEEKDDNTKTKVKQTPLQYAVIMGNTQIVQLLIECGADINEGEINSTSTLLYIASSKGHLGVVKLLIENGTDINKSNNSGWSSLLSS
jgi:ankyrin repeat protein